jgi:hypothetical protein
MNPSKGDEQVDDNTIRFCRSYVDHYLNECDGFEIVNLFSRVSSSPICLLHYQPDELIGAEYEAWLCRALENKDLVIAAWGCGAVLRQLNDKTPARNREDDVLNFTTESYPQISIECMRVSRRRVPYHPRGVVMAKRRGFPSPENRLKWYPETREWR